MTRKLASIQVIKDIQPIEGADKIVCATVEGWKVVVKNDEFNIGDKCVYIEIDSVLPDKPEFEFMKDRKYRVKTIKLKGQISQGICFPITILPKKYQNKDVGYDVTDIIGVTKWEPDSNNISFDKLDSSKMKTFRGMQKYWVRKFVPDFILKFVYTNKYTKKFANKWFKRETGMLSWPSWITKTDEERIQNIRDDFFEKYKDNIWVATEKVDGSSITFFVHNGGQFGVCSHNYQLKPVNDDKFRDQFWKAAIKFDVENKIRKVYGNSDVVIQGEIISPTIQKNPYKVEDIDFYIHNMVIDGIRLTNEQIKQEAEKLNLKSVPICFKEKILEKSVDDILKISDGKSVLNPKVDREGFVWRTIDKETNKIVSFKAVSNKYLLKEK